MVSSEFNDTTIIPQPGDRNTRWYLTIERIRARLPPLKGQAGKILKVSPTEDGCAWVSGGGEGDTVAFSEITGNPEDNPALRMVLEQKLTVHETSSVPFTIGCDENGLYVIV